jgi:hypothetical protein
MLGFSNIWTLLEGSRPGRGVVDVSRETTVGSVVACPLWYCIIFLLEAFPTREKTVRRVDIMG